MPEIISLNVLVYTDLLSNISTMANRIPSGPNTPGSQQSPTQQAVKIFIQRDYSDGTAVKFQTRFPQELSKSVSTIIIFSTYLSLNAPLL